MHHLLLDPGSFPAQRAALLEDRVAALLETKGDVLVIQGEAELALEAVAVGLGHPGLRALNVVTGPYGAKFGDCLVRAGAEVESLVIPLERAASLEEVEAALTGHPGIGVVAFVHAEAATGSANPAQGIAALAAKHGALVVMDAVASIGAQEVRVDPWGIDLCVIGPQKALAGPSGVSAVSISRRAWAALEANPLAPRGSVLSLLDWHDDWILAGRRQLTVPPAVLEMLALEAALDRVEGEGLAATITRHAAAAAATRAGLRLLGMELFVARDDQAAAVSTTARPPAGISPAELADRASRLAEAPLEPAPGALGGELVRIRHGGRQASLGTVLACLGALAGALASLGWERPAGPALEAALAAWTGRVQTASESAVRSGRGSGSGS